MQFRGIHRRDSTADAVWILRTLPHPLQQLDETVTSRAAGSAAGMAIKKPLERSTKERLATSHQALHFIEGEALLDEDVTRRGTVHETFPVGVRVGVRETISDRFRIRNAVGETGFEPAAP